MATEYIFVYGTLRKAAASLMHHQLARYCEYVAEAYMQGKLYEVDGYPGVVESDNADDRVYGEMYRIINKDLLFVELDQYEACSDQYPQPHEYVRKKLDVSIPGNGVINAWVYVFNHDVTGLQQIRSGDYLTLRKD